MGKQWLMDERRSKPQSKNGSTLGAEASCPLCMRQGIFANLFTNDGKVPGECEQASTALPLKVSPQFKAVFERLSQYLSSETRSLEDGSLEQECALLQKLISLADADQLHGDDTPCTDGV